MLRIFSFIKSFLFMLIISAGVAFLYYRFKQYKFLGKIYGGILVAFLWAILFNSILEPIDILFKNTFNVNILAVIIGAIIFVKILNKVSP